MRFWGSVTQGGGRQTALPWAIVSLEGKGVVWATPSPSSRWGQFPIFTGVTR